MTSSSTGGSSEFGVLANASDDGDDTLYDESSEPDASSSASGDDEDSVDSEDSDETLLTPLALFASSPTKLEKVEEGDEIDCFFATPTETMKRNADVDLGTSDLTIEISIPDTLAAKLLADTPLLNKVPDKKQQKHNHSPTLPSNAELATFPWPSKETISEPSPFPAIPDLCHDLNLTQSNIQMHSNASGKWGAQSVIAATWTSMSAPSPSTTTSDGSSDSRGRGRGRGKSRGGLGKYLRAKGRRGGGRPAVFGKRLLLDGEEPPDEEDEEAARELEQKFSRRQLGSNADRYAEPEPELDSDGEPIVEPEIDLSHFLERQRISDESALPGIPLGKDAIEDDDEDVDHSLSKILPSSSRTPAASSKKGRVSQIEWDKELAQLSKEKAAADAARDLKERFSARAEHLRNKPAVPTRLTIKEDELNLPPALPPADGSSHPQKGSKAEMEAFLDELLD
ncbi:hypothetical protein PTI98_012226 [Pleurotus ostreatus]|nr:hypothetical protein PTI98_012226 [Pleurotus ostreatus]